MIEVKNEDNYKGIYFGGITFRLNNEDDVNKAKKIVKDIFGEDTLDFGIEGGRFYTKKTVKSILFKYYGNIGSRFYKLFFREFIEKMKSAGIEITYQSVKYMDRYKAGFSKDDKLFYNLDNEKEIMDYINS